MMLKKAMILAAGFGTRLKPLTDSTPKALVPYNGDPMILNVINKLKDSGVESILVNTHHFAEQVEQYINENDFGVEVSTIREEEILGTGGAIKNAYSFFKDENEFLIYNSDVDSDIDLAAFYEYYNELKPVALLAVKKRNTARPLLVNKENFLAGRVINGKNHIFNTSKSPFFETAFCGIHIISTEIYNIFPPENSFDIMPIYMKLVENGSKIRIFDVGDIYWKDLGKP